MPAEPAPPTPDELRLVRTLWTGVTDDVAADRLGWTPRTLRRRLRGAMDKLGATSRFQAGALAALAGWLNEEHAADSGQPLVQAHKGWPWSASESV